MKSQAVLVASLVFIGAPAAMALTTRQDVTPGYVRSHAKEFSVEVAKDKNGLIAFTVVFTVNEPRYVIAHLTVRSSGRILAESSTPAFTKNAGNPFHFSVPPEHVATSDFTLAVSSSRAGTIEYGFQLADFVSPELLKAPPPTYQDFDQSPGHGWRALAEDQKRFTEAARMIESYLVAHSKQKAYEQATLRFHAAQCLAFEGSDSSIAAALAHLRDARVNPELPDSPIRWNDYVTATEAFLKGDLPTLKAARDRIASGPKWNGEVANLDVVDRLILKWGKSYADAYGMKIGLPSH